MSEEQLREDQREVQRLLGRCMLRLQQYERQMKAILAHHEIAGPVETLEAQLAGRVAKFSDKSLGTLVKSLFETYAVPEGHERDLLPDDKTPSDRFSMAISHRISMEPQKLAETRAAIEELVAMRNELVHHFIERFDLWTSDGCAAAMGHLGGCYERIDRHHRELADWVRHMSEARAMMASFTQTEVFYDMVVNGIAPDGSFDWPATGIVNVLRQAASKLSEQGWTRLDQAVAWIEAEEPEQNPGKYACRTWPQVLAESRLFDLEYRVGGGGGKVAWFRERVRAIT